MNSENTTGSLPAQYLTLTTHIDFYHQDFSSDGQKSEPLLAVQAGQDPEKAINQASMLVGSVNEIMTLLTEDGMETNTIFGLRFLLESSIALMESASPALLAANSPRGEE